MRHLLIFLLLGLLPACVVGDARHYNLEEDLDAEELAHLQTLTARKIEAEKLEERIYSIPILPLYFQDRFAERVLSKSGEKHYHLSEVHGLLYTLLFGSIQEGYFDKQGANRRYQEQTGLLMGALFRTWSGWKSREQGVKGNLHHGWSVLFGLLGYEVNNGEETVRVLWIPL